MRLLAWLVQLDERVLARLGRGLHRLIRVGRRTRPLTAAAVLLATAVIGTVAWRVSFPEGGPAVHSTVRIGVTTGDDIPDYVDTNRAELAGLLTAKPDHAVFALVTFSSYLAPQRLADVMARARGSEQLDTFTALVRVPVPRRQTELLRLGAAELPNDVINAMLLQAKRREGDAEVYARFAEATSKPDQRQLYESSAQLAIAEAAAYRDRCACVYAVVVRATPTVLLRAAALAEVRVVDAAPELKSLEVAVFDAPLPEQSDRVTPPPDDGLLATSEPASPSTRA